MLLTSQDIVKISDFGLASRPGRQSGIFASDRGGGGGKLKVSKTFTFINQSARQFIRELRE
jgi:hypothetical protein